MALITFIVGDLTDGDTLADDFAMLKSNITYSPGANTYSRTLINISDASIVTLVAKEGVTLVKPSKFGAGDIKKGDCICLSQGAPILKVLGVK